MSHGQHTDLRVFYPHGGQHLVLSWWCYNEQNRVIIAKTHAQIVAAFRHALEENSDARPHWYHRVELVAPSDEAQREHAAACRKFDVSVFASVLCGQLDDFREGREPLPPKVFLCGQYETDPEEIDRGEWEISTHYQCLHCERGYVLVGTTWEQLYDEKADVLFPKHPYRRSKGTLDASPSRAEKVKDGETYYAMTPNQRGLTHEVSPEPFSMESVMPRTDVLFFYRDLGKHDGFADLVAMADEVRLARKKEREDGERWREESERARIAERRANMKKVFG